MTWIWNDESHEPIVDEIERQSDRAAALMAAAFLDHYLHLALMRRVHCTPALEAKLFKGSGPLATFSARIDLGVLVGLYSERVQQLFHTIRRIRNEFAHQIQPLTFATPPIADLCKSIKLPIKVTVRAVDDDDDKEGSDLLEAADTPREMFMAGVKAGLLFCIMVRKEKLAMPEL